MTNEFIRDNAFLDILFYKEQIDFFKGLDTKRSVEINIFEGTPVDLITEIIILLTNDLKKAQYDFHSEINKPEGDQRTFDIGW